LAARSAMCSWRAELAEAGDRRAWIRGGRSWRSAGAAQSWRDRPSCFGGGFPGTGARSGRKWMFDLARGGRSSRALSGRIGESCFWAASPNWRGGRRYALAVWRAISEKAGGRGETSPKFEAGRQTPMIFAAWAAPAGRSKLLGGARRGLGAESGAALGESPAGPAGRRGPKFQWWRAFGGGGGGRRRFQKTTTADGTSRWGWMNCSKDGTWAKT
jgi:hypothetical protein